MTDDEIIEAFPGVTQEDLDEMRSGEVDWQQAMDVEGTVCLIWYDAEHDDFTATDNYELNL